MVTVIPVVGLASALTPFTVNGAAVLAYADAIKAIAEIIYFIILFIYLII